jgi:hypothetical protein
MIAAFHAGILIAILCPLALAIETLRRAVPKTRPGHSSQVLYRYRNPEGRDSVPESCASETVGIRLRMACDSGGGIAHPVEPHRLDHPRRVAAGALRRRVRPLPNQDGREVLG